jgi:hypothetical protein
MHRESDSAVFGAAVLVASEAKATSAFTLPSVKAWHVYVWIMRT